jgi:hypothetical protein
MPDKVTLRFEQFDSAASGDIITSGPLIIDGSFGSIADIDDFVIRGTSGSVLPSSTTVGNYFMLVTTSSITLKIATSSSAFGNPTSLPERAVFYSTNTEKYYDLRGTTWSEKPVQETIVYVSNVTNESLSSPKTRGAYFFYRPLTATWEEVLLGTHTHENKELLDRLTAVDINDPVGTKKFFTLEVVDTDNSEATYEYQINWEDLPESLPAVAEDEVGEPLYLGLDSEGNAEWKNNFLAAQSFQVKSKKVTTSGFSITFDDVVYDSSLDEVLVLVGKFFVYNILKPMPYNSTTKVLTVTLVSDPDTSSEVPSLDVGETVTIIVIRNGAAAILDTLATDYLKKEDVVTILSGGTVNSLRGYARKTDLRSYAKKYHLHSQFSRVDHNHDNRYAFAKHTHAEYITRKKALELIQEVLATDGGDILETLQSISDYLVENAPELETLATKTDIEELQDQIDLINEEFSARIQTYLSSNSASITSDKVKVTMDTGDSAFDSLFVEDGQPKDLTQVIEELYNISGGDQTLTDDEVELKEDIPVLLGSGFEGDFDTGDTAEEGSTIREVLVRLLQRTIVPTYSAGTIASTFARDVAVPEIGEDVELTIASTFTRNDSGLLNGFTVAKTVSSVTETVHTGSVVIPVTETVQALENPTTITVSGTYSAGEPKFNNIDTYYGRTGSEFEVPGKIIAGSTNSVTHTVTGKRALFYGAVSATPTIDSASIRSLFDRSVPESMSSFEYSYSVPIGSRFILFSLPQASGELSEIIYTEQSGIDILDLFAVQVEVNVSGANGVSPVFYRVYKFQLPNATTGQMTLTFRK